MAKWRRSPGVFRPREGFSERAVFVIDKQGRIAWSRAYDIPELPGTGDVFDALSALQPREGVRSFEQ